MLTLLVSSDETSGEEILNWLNAISTSKPYAQYLERDLADWAYWTGRGAEILELENQRVKVDEFERLQHGQDPRTGEQLRAARGADRRDETGLVVQRSRGLYDVEIFAPKSVSIAGMLDPRLVEAHKQVVKRNMQNMEEHAWTRVQRGGTESNRITGNLVMAPWLHLSSRARDPLIHTHVTVMNMTYDPTEERWKALQAVGIYQERHNLSEKYRADLAPVVQDFGYRIEHQSTGGWEISGVSEDLRRKFSQRAQQRDRLIEDWKHENPGQDISPRNVVALLRQNRERKDPRISQAQIHAEQLGRLTPSEHARLEEIVGMALERSQRQEIAPKLTPDSNIQKPAISNWEPFEKPTLRHPWNYGENGDGSVMVSNRPRQVRMRR